AAQVTHEVLYAVAEEIGEHGVVNARHRLDQEAVEYVVEGENAAVERLQRVVDLRVGLEIALGGCATGRPQNEEAAKTDHHEFTDKSAREGFGHGLPPERDLWFTLTAYNYSI